MLETKHQPLLPRRHFLLRLGWSGILAVLLLIPSWGIGILGYHFLEHFAWIDAVLNAAMILTGMGPLDKPEDDAGKWFSIFYCLYSGIAFLSLVAIMMAPVYHRFLHRFNLDEEGQPYLPPRADPPPMTTDM
jgi:hypothetical protein